MSITKWADAVVQILVPQTTAGACLAPDPCGECGPGKNMCYGGRWQIVHYREWVTDCKGVCYKKRKRTVCKVTPAGGPC